MAPPLQRESEPPRAAGEDRGVAGSPVGVPRRDEAMSAPRATAVGAGPAEAEAAGGQVRPGPRALPERPAPAGGVQRQAELEGGRPGTAPGQPGVARQPEPPATRSREQLPLVERRAPEGGARVQAGRDRAARHGPPGGSPVGPAAPVARSLDGPLPLAPRVIQRQPAASEAVSDGAASVETVQRAGEDASLE